MATIERLYSLSQPLLCSCIIGRHFNDDSIWGGRLRGSWRQSGISLRAAIRCRARCSYCGCCCISFEVRATRSQHARFTGSRYYRFVDRRDVLKRDHSSLGRGLTLTERRSFRRRINKRSNIHLPWRLLILLYLGGPVLQVPTMSSPEKCA